MQPITTNLRRVLRPVHRRIAEALPTAGVQRHYVHWSGTGRWGNFTEPVTFNEKVNWRILHDRRPIIVEACDKIAMKDAARRKVPDDAVLRVPRTLWAGTDLRDAPLSTEQPWILKPNHSSGAVLLREQATEQSLARVRDWLVSAPATQLGEWGYSKARPLLLMEEVIPSGPEGLTDYKIYVFDGVPRLVQVNRGRHTATPTLAFYDGDGRMLPMRHSRWPHPRGDFHALPSTWPDLLALAAELGAGWDFIRVDLYTRDDEVWFGEFTPYPGGGHINYRPGGCDRRMGDWWKLPEKVSPCHS